MNVTVPASVQTISWFAFNGWTKDRTITVSVKEGEEPDGWGYGWSSSATVIYPQ